MIYHNVTLNLDREYSFQNQLRKSFHFSRGSTLTGDLRLFASTWPFGVTEQEWPGKLGIEYGFSNEGKRWVYRGVLDSRRLWPESGGRIRTTTESDDFAIGPLGGMRDDREDYCYFLSGGTERRFRLKYVGFQCWISARPPLLDIKLMHFLPGDGCESYPVVFYRIPIERVLFLKELKLCYDAEGFLEDASESPYVRIDEVVP